MARRSSKIRPMIGRLSRSPETARVLYARHTCSRIPASSKYVIDNVIIARETDLLVPLAAAVGIAFHVVINRTRFGYDIRASGMNPTAARVGGVPPKRMIMIGMLGGGPSSRLFREVREKKFGTAMPADFKERNRQMRFLQQRGFTHEQIYSVFKDDNV